jgi:hypothetical protein
MFLAKASANRAAEFLTRAWYALLEFLLRNAYLLSLAVLYLCGLQQVNVINAVLLLYFATFLIFPQLAKIGWM